MHLTPIYEGPTVFAELLQGELERRGIPCVLEGVGLGTAMLGSAGAPNRSAIRISEEDLRLRRAEVEECLALVAPLDAIPDTERETDSEL